MCLESRFAIENSSTEGTPEHDERVNCKIDIEDAVVGMAQFVSILCLWHEVCKAEQKVGQEEDCRFIEGLDVIVKPLLERHIPLQVDAESERDEILNSELCPDILSEAKHKDWVINKIQTRN